MAYRHEARARGDEPLGCRHIERAGGLDGNDIDRDVPLAREKAERAQHGVVLVGRRDHMVATADGAQNRLVERQRRVVREDEALGMVEPEEPGELASRVEDEPRGGEVLPRRTARSAARARERGADGLAHARRARDGGAAQLR